MNTAKYDPATRKSMKRDQRGPAFAAFKQKELAERTKLEKKLHERNELINRLKAKLAEAGIAADEIAKIAA